jgi:transposase-like protein
VAIIRDAREVTGSVAKTCRHYGISWQVFDTWLRRYEAGGVAGLRERSRRPAQVVLTFSATKRRHPLAAKR